MIQVDITMLWTRMKSGFACLDTFIICTVKCISYDDKAQVYATCGIGVIKRVFSK